MTPIQLWLPTFFGGIARPELRSDMKRMFSARRTENVMWSVPGWSGPPRWTQEGLRVSCLNGDGLECARIQHVGEKGVVVGPGAASFPGRSVADILDHWLNDDFVRVCKVDLNEPLRVKVPHPVNGGVALVEAEVTPPGAGYFPFAHAGEESVAAQWPPRPDMPTTVSPEIESGRLSFDPRKTLPLRLAWLPPFDDLQPLLISPDDMLARDRMRQIAETSGDDCVQAHAQATTEARDWVSEGRASVNEAWLQPIIATEKEEGALFAIEAKFGISATSLEQAYKNDELRRRLDAPMSIRRAWAVPGLMWGLFLARLANTQPYWTCERCGKLISGRGHKRFCSAEDDPDCYQARKAGDKRRSRVRGSSRS